MSNKKGCLTLSSNQDSLSFFISSGTLCSRIIVVHSSNVRRKSSTARKTDSARRGSKVSCWINLSVLLFFRSCLMLDEKTRRHLRQARRLFWVLFQPLDRLHRVKKRRRSNEQFIIAPGCTDTEFLQYQKYRAIRLQNWWF